MKTTKILPILLVLMISSLFSFAQDITKDTTLANKHFDTAQEYYNNKSYDTAIVYFEKASALYHEHKLWRKYLQSETKQGECYQKLWQLDMAIVIIKPAIEKTLLHINENDTIVADSYNILGIQYYYQSKNDSTLFYWKKTLQIRKEIFGEKHVNVANIYNNIGLVYNKNNEYDLSLQYQFKALQIRKELLGEKHTYVAISYNNIGIVYADKNEYDLALEYYFKALQINKELIGEKHTSVALSYNNIGIIYNEKNEYDIALQYYFKALQIRKELFGEKHPLVATSYNNIGNVYKNKNQYDLALQYYFKALQIFKTPLGEKHTFVAGNYINIGVVYWYKNEYDLALQYYFKSLQIYIELLGEKHTDVADTYNNIGLVYYDKNKYDLALLYYFKSLQIKKELHGEKHTSVAMTYNNIGLVYENQDEYDLALQYYFKALQINKDLLDEKHTSVALIYLNIGNVNNRKNEYDLALQYYFKSLQINKELIGEKHTSVALSYNNIGIIYNEKNEYDITLQYYQKAIAASLRNFNDTLNVCSVPIIKDYLNWNELLKALQAKAEIFANTSITLPKFKTLAKLELSLRHYQACDTLISQVRKEMKTKSDKITLGEKANEVYKGAVNVCINLADAERSLQTTLNYHKLAFYFSEKNKSSVLLEALAGAEAQKFSGIPDTLLNKEHKLQIDIALYKKILAEQPDSTKEILFQDKLFNANRQYDELITDFESSYPKYFELKYNRKPASVEEIQNILDNKTAIISYFTGDSIITIFTITKKNLDIKTVPAIENLADTIRDFRNGLLYTNSSMFAEAYKKYAYKMCRQLIPENMNKEITNLIIIPDAELSMIPFETLLTENPEDKEWKDLSYLVKKYNISYSYSANLFYKTFPKEPTEKIETTELNDWLAFAPVFDDSNTAGLTLRTRELLQKFDTDLNDTLETRGRLVSGGYISPLPGTESEVQAIFKQFDEKGKKALVQIKKSANEEFLKSKEVEKYKYLHFATHGFVNTEKPELSGILLAQDSTLNEDGILYSGEIYNLKLNADLTVLSACETGLGEIKKGEGLIGLTRALLYAGSKNIIVSLWKVADESTSDLMIDFYKNLLEEEQEKQEFSQALQQAKLKMIAEGKYAHPFYWSPFILIGK
ncbi:MAG: CHAT domain-containing protein [Bacteroidales bacterium]|nr:CHAT domain-containing protein [Bacteroidales bacterium]